MESSEKILVGAVGANHEEHDALARNLGCTKDGKGALAVKMLA